MLSRFPPVASAVAGLSVLALTATATAVPRQDAGTSPCALVKSQIESASNNDASSPVVIPGQLAQDCLLSMPFNSTLAVDFLHEIWKYFEFQSTLELLKDPPPQYNADPVDFVGWFESIGDRASKGQFDSQYEFDLELTHLVRSANDGHFYIQPCSTAIFSFTVPGALVSVSDDGTTIPKIWLLDDLVQKDSGAKVSAVAKINGQNASDFVQTLALLQSNQDYDAQYNSMFYSPAKYILPMDKFSDSWSTLGYWPNASSFQFTFENGSQWRTDTFAKVSGSKFSATDGDELFELVCVNHAASGDDSEDTSDDSSVIATEASEGPAGYPEPVVRDPYNFLVGYYLSGPGLDDVAVMQIPTFEVVGGLAYGDGALPLDEPATFAQSAVDFIRNATLDGKTKMVIDVSANGGGDVLSGYDLFHIFFPQTPLYSATRFRSHDAINYMGQALATVNESQPELFQLNIALGSQVKPDQKTHFATWEDMYGPYLLHEIPSSALYATFDFNLVSDANEPVVGYGGVPLPFSKPPFAAEDIVILTDGFCASTCTVFVELMKTQGVRSIAFGGQPELGPMQAIGGVKGGQSISQGYIVEMTESAFEIIENSSTPILSDSDLEHFKSIAPIPPTEFPLKFYGMGVNFRSAFREEDTTLPLQFIYEAAEFRRFYTADNILKPETTWIDAANVAFNDGLPVPGSTDGPGSLTDVVANSRKHKGHYHNATHTGSAASGPSGGLEKYSLSFIAGLAAIVTFLL